jgi:hypothetical protein
MGAVGKLAWLPIVFLVDIFLKHTRKLVVSK